MNDLREWLTEFQPQLQAEQTAKDGTQYPRLYTISEWDEYGDRIDGDSQFFLTRPTAQDYLDQYGYNHADNAHTYAHWINTRSPDLHQAIDFLTRLDLEKSTLIFKEKP